MSTIPLHTIAIEPGQRYGSKGFSEYRAVTIEDADPEYNRVTFRDHDGDVRTLDYDLVCIFIKHRLWKLLPRKGGGHADSDT